MDILEQVQIILNEERAEKDAAEDYRSSARALIETELGNIIYEEIKAATIELVEEQKLVVREALEERKRLIREVVEEQKLSIRAKAAEIRQSILRFGEPWAETKRD
jgi:hypothetical protein